MQFFDWTRLALTGDFGSSFFFKDKVSTLIAQRMPITLTLGLTGLAIALVVSLLLGLVCLRTPARHVAQVRAEGPPFPGCLRAGGRPLAVVSRTDVLRFLEA